MNRLQSLTINCDVDDHSRSQMEISVDKLEYQQLPTFMTAMANKTSEGRYG